MFWLGSEQSNLPFHKRRWWCYC